MCDAVKEYGRKQSKLAEERTELKMNVNFVERLMSIEKFSMEKALNTLGLQGKERQAVEDELKKKDVS